MSTLIRLVLLYCLTASVSASAATFNFRFTDGPGEGFNDPTPFTPVGGNTATTLGQARRNLLTEAGRIWGALLTSNVPIEVDVAFNPQECDAMSGTLASATPLTFFRDFLDGVSPDTFFASALADSRAGEDLMLQTMNPNTADIRVTFNMSVDSNPACLRGGGPRGPGFYYGFDHNRGTGIDALVVALHELAHGFGFGSEIDVEDGTSVFTGDDGVERFSTYVTQIFDQDLGRAWPMLAPSERIQSAVNSGGLVWNGSSVNAQVAMFSAGVTNQRLRLNAPAPATQGSSVSHWDTAVVRNILMEPNISFDLSTSFVDVTVCALRDIGWVTTRCPDNPPARGATPMALPQSVTVIEDTPLMITLGATDAESNPLIFAIPARPIRGILSGVPRNVIYTPTANANGTDSFRFVASDGDTTSGLATVSITITPVNDAPVVTALTVSTATDQPAAITLAGSDADGDAVTFEVVTNTASGSLSGTGTMRTYQPNAGFVGMDSFTYRGRDATSMSAPATVTINVVGAAPTPTPIPAPAPTTTPVPGGRGGGGGAMNEMLLLALTLLAIAARLSKLRFSSAARDRCR